MADEMYNIGVRKALNDMGVGDERIGFNPGTGYVSVDGKDIIRPQSNVDGSTYTDQASLNSIRGNVNQLNNAYNVQQKVLNPQQTVNPMDQQFNQLLQTLQGRIANPQAINPYATPQYAAAQAQMQQAADRGIRANQEAAGASGFGRSTVNTQGAQRIQNAADQQLQTQVVPQIIASEQARQQQELGNLMNLLGVLGQQQGVYDTRANNQFNQAAQVLDFITGQQNRAEDRAFDREKFDYGKGVDQRNFDYGKSVDDRNFDYRQKQDELAQQNLEDEKAYRRQRDSEQDRQWWSNYERQGQQFAAQQGLQWAQLNQREKERISDEAWRREQSGLQQDQTLFNQGLQLFKETGKMPEYMNRFGISTQAINNQSTQQDVIELYNQLSSGKLKPEQAIKTIDDKVKIGAGTPQDAEVMKQAIYTLYPELNPSSGGGGGSSILDFLQPPESVKNFGQGLQSGAADAAKGFGQWWLQSFVKNLVPNQ